MGMNFDYGTLGVNNAYATSFKGAPAQQQASVPIMDGPSDLDLLSLSTKQAKTEEKSNTKTILGFVAAAAITAATVYAHSKGKKINGEAGSFFKNIGTGFKNFFKKVGKDGKIITETTNKTTKQVAQELVDAKQKALDDIAKEKGVHSRDYRKAKKGLKQAKIEQKKISVAKGQLLSTDTTYQSMKGVKNQTSAELRKLEQERSSLTKQIDELVKKKDAAAEAGSKVKFGTTEQKELAKAQKRLAEIGSPTIKAKGGAVQTAATGKIADIETKLAAQKAEIAKYSQYFDDIAQKDLQQAAAKAKLQAFESKLAGRTATTTEQAQLVRLQQAAKSAEEAYQSAKTLWATNVGEFTIPDILKAKP